MILPRFTAILAFAALALAGCASGPWERENASQEEVDWNLKSCAQAQAARARTIYLPHPTVGMAPVTIASPGTDVESCMRARGFVRPTERKPRAANAQ